MRFGKQYPIELVPTKHPWLFSVKPNALMQGWAEIMYCRTSGSNDNPRRQMHSIMASRPIPCGFIGYMRKSVQAGNDKVLRSILERAKLGEWISLTVTKVDRLARDYHTGRPIVELLKKSTFRLYAICEFGRKPISAAQFIQSLIRHVPGHALKVNKSTRTRTIKKHRKRGSTGYYTLEDGKHVFDSPKRFARCVAVVFEAQSVLDPKSKRPLNAIAVEIAKYLRRRNRKSSNGELWNTRKVLNVLMKHAVAYRELSSTHKMRSRKDLLSQYGNTAEELE